MNQRTKNIFMISTNPRVPAVNPATTNNATMPHAAENKNTSILLVEDESVARNLSSASAAGLAALDSLDRHQPQSDSWKSEQITFLQQAAKPDQAQLLLMVIAPIQKLVEYSASGGRCAAK